MSVKRFWFVSLVSSFIYLNAFAQQTDLQRILTPTGTPTSELIKKHGLIRLWPLTSISNTTGTLDIQDSVNRSQSSAGGSKIFNRSVGVGAKKCGVKNYARFSNGAIYSEETALLSEILKDTEYNPVQLADDYFRKKIVFAESKLGRQQSSDPYSILHSNQTIKKISQLENQNAVYNTTSLVRVERDSKQRFAITSTNYTIGGWFKPDLKNQKSMSLFKKYFYNPTTGTRKVEWEIFASGNTIYFHNFHDVEVPAESKYLSNEEARRFRGKNAHFFGEQDYYDDIVEKQKLQNMHTQTPAGAPKKLIKVFVDLPIAHKGAKPVPAPPEQPPILFPPVVVNPDTGIPVPNWQIPEPPAPINPIIYGYLSSSKDHLLGFDLKNFWWGTVTSLGGCYGCSKPGLSSDVWHHFSISVHLNDPLGPYVDLYMIRDPNESRFGKNATLSSNFRYGRVELTRPEDREMASRPLFNPVTHGFVTEAGCSGSVPCTRSELEIGGVDNSRPYSGFMRGIFISKRALLQAPIFEMAAEFNPQDDALCTYNAL